MAEERNFRRLIGLVRAGDDDAATELVRRYEHAIRRAVRIRLRDSRLRRIFDSMDVCQSVLASFFARAALGQYELETPQQLLRLLTAMAHNKLAGAAEHAQAQCRDHRRLEAGDAADREIAAASASPSEQVALRDLLGQFQARLACDERRIVELRLQGWEWSEIATEIGDGAEALRKRHARALDRVARELGLEEVGNDGKG
jgi:RNA polymerase sigma-70 factor (ECF subfamily)